MTIKQQGGIFGRNPSFNDVSANTLSVGSLSGVSSLQAVSGEKVLNSEFTDNINNWSVDNGYTTLTHGSGVMNVTNSGTTSQYSNVFGVITNTTVGTYLEVKLKFATVTSVPALGIRLFVEGGSYFNVGGTTDEQTFYIRNENAAYVRFRIRGTTNVDFDYVRVRSVNVIADDGQVLVPQGTASEPGLSFIDNSSVGFYQSAAAVIGLSGADLKLDNGNGIDFSATSGTGTSELFDDYEEGTWTPTVQGAGTAGTYTLSGTTAKYTKVGNQVTAWAQFGFSAASGGTNYIVIGGLPFTYAAGAGVFGAVRADSFNFTTATPASLVVAATTGLSGTTLGILELRDNAGPVDAPISGVSASTLIGFTITYQV